MYCGKFLENYYYYYSLDLSLGVWFPIQQLVNTLHYKFPNVIVTLDTF